MNRIILVVLISGYLLSCQHVQKKTPKQSIIQKVYSDIGREPNAKNILLVPQNSCEHCREYVFSNYEKLKSKEIDIVYLTNEDTSYKPYNLKQLKVALIQPIEKSFDLYGITLYQMKDDSIINIIELNSSNIADELSLLISDRDLNN